MAAANIAAEIDRLYQLPLSDFTSVRNALAKTGGADVRNLAKPTVPAWAVNQLYWRERQTYDALIEAAVAQQRTHKAVLAGRAGDLRATGKAHDAAVEQALRAALALLQREGHPATEATRQGILNTLRALPGDEPPGRLTRTLQPGGFEMLAGLSLAAPKKPAASKPPPAPRRGRGTSQRPKADPAALARAKADVEAAARRLRQAQHAAQRAEFEAARASRELDKAERVATQAQQAFEAAREALEEAKAALPPALRAKDAATRRAEEAVGAAETAREALATAETRLAGLKG